MSVNGNDKVSKGFKSIFKFKFNKQSKKDRETETPRTSKSSVTTLEEELEVASTSSATGPLTSTEGLPTRPPRTKITKSKKKLQGVKKKVDTDEERPESKILSKEKEKSEGNSNLIPCENLIDLETDIQEHHKDEASYPKINLTVDHKREIQRQNISGKKRCPDSIPEFKGELYKTNEIESLKYSIPNDNLIDLETNIQNYSFDSKNNVTREQEQEIPSQKTSSKQIRPDRTPEPKRKVPNTDETDSRKVSTRYLHQNNKHQNEKINQQELTGNINNTSEANKSIMSMPENQMKTNKNQNKQSKSLPENIKHQHEKTTHQKLSVNINSSSITSNSLTSENTSILSKPEEQHNENNNQNAQTQDEQLQRNTEIEDEKKKSKKEACNETENSEENNRNGKSETDVKDCKEQKRTIEAGQQKLLEEATESLKKIEKEMDEIEKRVENFKGATTDSDEYYYLDETLTNILIKLDNVPSKNIPIVREERRKTIKYGQRITKMLDQKIKENQIKAGIPAVKPRDK